MGGPLTKLTLADTCLCSESVTEIVGGPEVHVDHHSSLELTCRVHSGDKTPAYIIWQREDKVTKHNIIRLFLNRKLGAALNLNLKQSSGD